MEDIKCELIEKSERFRSSFLDQLRGLAIVLMIIFHCAYSLAMFRYVQIDFYEETLWYALPRIIVTLFMFCVGMSLALTHTEIIKWKKFFTRFFKISVGATLVSISTYLMFPTRWIYFGTLHSIAVCSVFALLFIKVPRIALLIGSILLILSNFFGLDIPWAELSHKSMDYISPFPWLGIVLLGIFAVNINLHRINLSFHEKNKIIKMISLLGRHSLIIYLIHQPIIIGILFCFNYLMSLG